MQSHLSPISTIKPIIAKLGSSDVILKMINQKKILLSKNKIRKYVVSDSLGIVGIFENKIIKYNDLPDGEAFFRAFVAFRILKMFVEAKGIFSLIQKDVAPPIKECVIGSCSYSVMLEIKNDADFTLMTVLHWAARNNDTHLMNFLHRREQSIRHWQD